MIILVDDGTLDTVLQCDICNERIRYTYHTAHGTYQAFVTWAIVDANDSHVCDDFEEGN